VSFSENNDPRATDATVTGQSSTTEHIGALIGRYKLLEQIGEGGFGSVWAAEQREPVKRRVALKIIKLGMDTKQVIARFEAERQALAVMDHPNIARVLDAGATDSGRPFFVMELVKGITITEYCDTEKLDTQQRLELFIQVCNAVQHAHQKGIIHRDIKPSNVLVTLHDGVPVPKVIDFGIAKATHAELTQKTVYTELGQMIGTPLYMSPEQAEMSGRDIDTRADVYSLGVLLYELLTGTTPLDAGRLRRAGYNEMVRIIREEVPHKPSTRVGSASRTVLVGTETIALVGSASPLTPEGPHRSRCPGSSIEQIANHRHTDPKSLLRLLRGDLDWIVMKCLEKDRTRRYETANGLALDIVRHLGNEPVVAGPPSRAYRMRKFVRRNRVAVVGATILAAALILGVVGTSWGFVRAVVAQRNAVQRAAESEAVTQFLSDMLAAVDPAESGKDVSVREILDKSSKTLGERFTDQPQIEARLRSTIGNSYFELGAYDQAERHLPVAFEMYRRLRGEEDVETVRSMNALAYLYYRQLRLDEAWALNERSAEKAHNFLGEENTETVRALRLKGALMQDTGRWEGLLDLHQKTTEQLRRTPGEENLDTLKSMHNLALLYGETGRINDAGSLFEQTLAIYHRVFGDEHPHGMITMRMFVRTHFKLGHSQEAVTLQERVLATSRRVLGEEHMQTLWETYFLASFYAEVDRFTEARLMFEQALGTFRRVLGEQSMQTAWAMDFYAWILLDTGPQERRNENAPEAIHLVERAGAIYGEKTPRYPWVRLNTLALAQHITGDTEKAIETQERSLMLMPEEAALRWEYEGRLATYYRSVGRVDDAARVARQRLETLRRLLERGGERPQVLNDYAHDLLTIELLNLRDPSAALPLAERACAMAEERGTYGRWNYLDTLALAQHMTGNTAKAIETQRRALGLVPPEYHQQRREQGERLAEYEAALAQKTTGVPSPP
jgi:serine/threonine protein kinase/tetratricopeptide (TPR) repeat protein